MAANNWLVRKLTKWNPPKNLVYGTLAVFTGSILYLYKSQTVQNTNIFERFSDYKTFTKTPNFYYSVCGLKGEEKEQKDSYALFPDIKLSNTSPLRISFFGVFHGEGGASASKYVSQNLPTIFGTSLKQRLKDLTSENAPAELIEAISPTLSSAFNQTYEQFKAQAGSKKQESTDAVVFVFAEGYLWAATVGYGSKGVLARTFETAEFPAYSFEERLGKWEKPYIEQSQFTSKDQFLIIGSKGLWDCMQPSEAVSLIHSLKFLNPYTQAANLAQALVYTARASHNSAARSNITASVFIFEPENEEKKVTEELTEKEK